jgi:hypothetical protein
VRVFRVSTALAAVVGAVATFPWAAPSSATTNRQPVCGDVVRASVQTTFRLVPQLHRTTLPSGRIFGGQLVEYEVPGGPKIVVQSGPLFAVVVDAKDHRVVALDSVPRDLMGIVWLVGAKQPWEASFTGATIPCAGSSLRRGRYEVFVTGITLGNLGPYTSSPVSITVGDRAHTKR